MLKMSYNKIKSDLEKLGCHHIRRIKRDLFDDIRFEVPRGTKSKVLSFIMGHYRDTMKLRADMDDTLSYMYLEAKKDKIDKVKKDLLDHKRRFKWLYDQIKDEETFIKNVKEEKDEKV